jgi:hypothetical protein
MTDVLARTTVRSGPEMDTPIYCLHIVAKPFGSQIVERVLHTISQFPEAIISISYAMWSQVAQLY